MSTLEEIMASQLETVSVQLSNGAIVKVEAVSSVEVEPYKSEKEKLDNADTDEFEDEDISFGMPSFASVRKTIVGFSNEIVETFKEVSPSKASVEFGLKLTSDKQTIWASIVPVAGETHLKITLEWSSQEVPVHTAKPIATGEEPRSNK
jgi:copper chaperone CopZ